MGQIINILDFLVHTEVVVTSHLSFYIPKSAIDNQYISEWYDCIPAQLNLQKPVAILTCSESISFSTLPPIPYIKDNCGIVGNI